MKDQLPWVAPAVTVVDDIPLRLPVGTVLTAEEAVQIFGHAYDPTAVYIVADGSVARRVVDEHEADANGLNWTFSGVACPRGHLTTRRLRNDGRRGGECKACRSAKKNNPARPERASRKSSHPTGGPMKMT